MKNICILLLVGFACASVAADDDSIEFESDEILIDVGPAEPVVTQYSSSASVVQQNQRKVQPIEIITPFGYRGIFDEPQQYFSASSFQGLKQYFPALFTTLGQTNIPFQSIQQSQFAQPAVASQVQSNFNPDRTFLLNRNIVPVSGLSNVGGQQASQTGGVIGLNQPVPTSLQYNFRVNQNNPGFQSASGFMTQPQLTFGSVSSFVPKQFIPVKATFSQFGSSSNQPQKNQFAVNQPFLTVGQNSFVPTFESNSLASPAVQQSYFTAGGQRFQGPQQYQAVQNQQPSNAQQLPASGSSSVGLFSSNLMQPIEQPISSQNSVFGVQNLGARPQFSSQQSSAIQTFGQPTAQQVAFGQPLAVEQATFGQPTAVGQQTFGQISAVGRPSAIGQSTFGQSSATNQQSFRQSAGSGQQATFGQPAAAGQFGQSAIGQQTFGQTSVAGQQASFVQQDSFGQQASFGASSAQFGQPAAAGEQAFGQSTIGQQTFGQTSVAGQQASFGQQDSFGPSSTQFRQSPVEGQQSSAFQQPSVESQTFNENSFSDLQPQAVRQESSFTQSSFGAQPSTFSSTDSLSQAPTFQTGGQNSFSSQFNSAAPQPVPVNQPTFIATLRSDSNALNEQSSPFRANEFPSFEFPSASFKTDVTKVAQDLDYDVSIDDAKFNTGFDFDETESFDTKVYDHAQ